jgi:8-oxo-dGTP pyrophosphatase MutT (NUDIX family)
MGAKAEVAIAILYQDNQFLMQLRDNNPNIVYPGYWAFFGGHIEPEESPEAAMWRELEEEIGYIPPTLVEFRRYTEDPQVVRHVFHAPLIVAVETLQLNEGWDLGLFTIEDIQRGDRYSDRAGQIRPLGEPHQKILSDFLDSLHCSS